MILSAMSYHSVAAFLQSRLNFQNAPLYASVPTLQNVYWYSGFCHGEGWRFASGIPQKSGDVPLLSGPGKPCKTRGGRNLRNVLVCRISLVRIARIAKAAKMDRLQAFDPLSTGLWISKFVASMPPPVRIHSQLTFRIASEAQRTLGHFYRVC